MFATVESMERCDEAGGGTPRHRDRGDVQRMGRGGHPALQQPRGGRSLHSRPGRLPLRTADPPTGTNPR